RFEAEAQLREAEEKFRTIVERNPAVIYTQEFDPDSPNASRTTYISPRQDLLFGYSTEEVLGDPTLWTRTIHPDDRERVLAADVARRLDRLVTNLLDLDRLARGIVTPKLQPTDVGTLVRRVVAESDLIADSRLRTDIASVTIPVDAAKVERIVENLLANTVRHAPVSSTVWIGVREERDGVTILVEDDGPGIAPDLVESIFEPFRQGPDAPQHSPGVGVGLTLVRRFAELHGGRAWVEGREGGGASFRVFLPAEP